MSSRIALRVDASAAMGLGHLQRCIALAQALCTAGAHPIFVTRALGVDVAERIVQAGFEAIMLPPPPSGSELPTSPAHAAWAGVPASLDAKETIAAITSKGGCDWLVVDHYAFDERWHAPVKAALACSVLVIDDLADRPLSANLVVDHNPAPSHATKYSSLLDAGASLLGGPRYALLGQAYLKAARHQPNEAVRSIGIFMGGTDPANLSCAALAACRGIARYDGPIEIVSTRANPHLSALREAVQTSPGTRLTLDLPDLAAFFARHDLQIGAGGGASWERACIGAPTLVLCGAENQRVVTRGLEALGAAAVTDGGRNDQDAIGRAVAALLASPQRRLELALRGRELVDGRGTCRVALRMLAHKLYLRPAHGDDARLIFDWRNHPSTRAVSRQSQPIEWAAHLSWMSRVLADPDRLLRVAAVGDIPVGVLRMDRTQGGAAEISLYLDPSLHSLGLGGAMLRAAELEARSIGVRELRATVLDGNTASRRLFLSAGFRFEGGEGSKPISPLQFPDRTS